VLRIYVLILLRMNFIPKMVFTFLLSRWAKLVMSCGLTQIYSMKSLFIEYIWF